MKLNDNIKKVEDFIKHFESLEKTLAETLKEQSDVDKSISAWYHKVEGTELGHVSMSHKLMKEIKPLLERRRNIKLESLLLRSTCDSLRQAITKLKQSHQDQMKKHTDLQKEMVERAKE